MLRFTPHPPPQKHSIVRVKRSMLCFPHPLPKKSVAQYFERFFEHSTLGFASQRSFLRKTKKTFAHNLHTISDPIDHVDVELFFHAVGDVDSMDMVSRVTLLQLSLPHVSSCLAPTIPWNSFVRSFGRYAIRGILLIIVFRMIRGWWGSRGGVGVGIGGSDFRT